MTEVAARTNHELRMLETMVDCAHRVSMALGETAKAETDSHALIKLSDAFCRGFQAVRLGIRLCHALRAPPKPVTAVEQPKSETLEVETPEVERAESAERPDGSERLERERDRDYEPVSLSKFLATLGVVATQAERVADRLPADVATQTLPALRDLLARANSDPPAASAAPAAPAATTVLTRPRPKAALLSTAAAPPPRPLTLRGPNLPRPPPRPQR